MRGNFAAAAFILFALTTASHAAEDDTKSSTALIAKWASAFNNNDPGELLKFYDLADDTQIISSSGLSHRGEKAIRKAFDDTQRQLRFKESQVKNVNARLLGKTVIVTFEHRFQVRLLGDDSRWQVHVRTTSVLHRFDGDWKIVHEHSSPIRGVPWMTRLEESKTKDSQ
jgi:uncharacterized protein (TIGR02246 family)